MNRVQNNILQPLRIVNAREKQAHRSIACNGKYMPYPIIVPQGTLLNHQFRLASGSISSIKIYDIEDLDTGLTIPSNIYSTTTHGEVTYFKCKNASIVDLDRGQYYLEINTSAGSLYTELFSVVKKLCCYPQLIWSNDCSSKYEDFEDGFAFNFYIRTSRDIEPDSILQNTFTEQNGKLFKEESQLQDWFRLEAGPYFSYMQRVFNSIAAHDNIVFVDKTGELSEVQQLELESFSDISNDNKCLYGATIRFRQSDAHFENGCCEGILETAEAQGLPIPDFAGCEGTLSCIAPSNLSIVVGSTNGLVKWSHSPNAASYEVSINGGSWQDVGYTNQYFVPGNTFEPCSDQTIRLRSKCDDAVYSTPTTIVFETLSTPCGSGIEENFFVVATGQDSINVQYDGSAGVSTYTIQWKKEGELWTEAEEATTANEEYDITGLQQGTKYIVRFRPNCPDNECEAYGVWTQSFAVTDSCALDMNITVTLGDCENEDANVLVEVYNAVGEHTISIYQDDVFVGGSNEQSANFSLSPNEYEVRLSDTECTATPVTLNIQDPCGCNAPKAFEPISKKDPSTVELYWQEIVNAASYTLYWKKSADENFTIVENLSVSSYVLTELEECTTYQFKVKTICEDESESEFSNEIHLSTLGCGQDVETVETCPTAKNLNVGAIQTDSSTVNWGEVSGATGYNLRWKKTIDSVWQQANNINITAKHLTGLVACTQYEFQVQTICESSNSDWSESQVWSTEGCDTGDCDEDQPPSANAEHIVINCDTESGGININVLQNDTGQMLEITHINATAVVENQVVDIGDATVELLDKDATVGANFEIVPDSNFGGDSITFNYTITNAHGTDVGTVTVPVNSCCAMTATATNGVCSEGVFDLTIDLTIQNGFTDDVEVFIQETDGGAVVSQGTFSYDDVVLEDYDGDDSTIYAIIIQNVNHSYCSYNISNHELPACPKATDDFQTIDCNETVQINVLGNDTEG